MQKNQCLANTFFLLALGLICLFAYTILFSAITLIRGYSITAWQLSVAAIMMLITEYYACHELFKINPKKVFLKCAIILTGIILLCIGFAYSIYDVSSDGQWYHQETVYRIKNGWNPYVKELPVPKKPGLWDPKLVWCSGPHIPPNGNPNGDQDVLNIKYLNINHFPKSVELTESAIYALTNRIETGKAINSMMMLASLFLCLSVFYKWNRWNLRKNWLLSLTLICNTISLSQLTSFCLDGLMYSVLLCLICIFILLLQEKNKYVFFLFGLLIMILVNIKYTAIVYTAIFSLAFAVYLAIRKNPGLLKKMIITGSLSFVVGFFFIGFHPYMTNLIKYDTVFEGLKETRDYNSETMPGFMKGKSRFTNFFISYGARSFGRAADSPTLKQILKIPFTIGKKEIKNANDPELSVAGFGPFFSGALIICLILLMFMVTKYRRELILRTVLFTLGFLLFSIFIIPDPWWARFVPQVWLIPCLVLFLSEYIDYRAPVLKFLLYVSLWLNILWAFSGILDNILITSHINYQMAQLKTQRDPIRVEYCGYIDNWSNSIRFHEFQIPYEEKYVTGAHIYNVIHSSTRFETAEELPALPQPFLVRVGRKLNAVNSN
jgi:hypothetical protein